MESLSISPKPLLVPSELTLPPLPKIYDETILRKVFTHSSFIGRPKYSIDLFEDEDEGRDNEKLELLGDNLLDCAVLGLLQDLYPNLNVGNSTKLKSALVNNTTLRELSKRYRLHERLVAPPEQLPTLMNGDKVLANLFEAYIAGVFYSYLKHAVGEGSSRLSRGQAIDHLDLWLRPLFQPIAESMLSQLKAEQLSRQLLVDTEDDDTDRKAQGANARLNQWFIFKEGGQPSYASSNAGLQGWKTLCTAVDRDGKSWYGEATRSTKKAAQAVAAYKVIKQFEQERPDFTA
uniref:RNase III domain-containing protein n=1 Tax=Kwoniella bestiolae CBS 10118 TaxID=1296100 RepID=A0A1B9G6W3_9TREE|nr:hypothetical protein I302_04418 [Kwoniella bestiolae CBS 10118]OCF26731.1 hypothetical protein I302_04418 [Kwoniella bestiolae CBS 10118]